MTVPRLGDLVFAPWYDPHDGRSTQFAVIIGVWVETFALGRRQVWRAHWLGDGYEVSYSAVDFTDFRLVSRMTT